MKKASVSNLDQKLEQKRTLVVQMQTQQLRDDYDQLKTLGKKKYLKYKIGVAQQEQELAKTRQATKDIAHVQNLVRKEQNLQWVRSSAQVKAESEYNTLAHKRKMSDLYARDRLGRELHKHRMLGMHEQFRQEKKRDAVVSANITANRRFDTLQYLDTRHAQSLRHREEKENIKKKNKKLTPSSFAFGARYGILDTLNSAGPVGNIAGSLAITAEAGVQGFTASLKLLTLMVGATALIGHNIASWYNDSVSFNQQAERLVGSTVNDDPGVTKDLGQYYRRVLARELPLTTRQTLMTSPKFMSMGKTMGQADTLVQFASDVAFGLNPQDTTRASHLAEKLVSDTTSIGHVRTEELRQAANLGLPVSMIVESIKDQWNSPEFQQANRGIEILDTAGVFEKISEGAIGANLGLNAYMAVSNKRLGTDKVGEYSQWASLNTIAGLSSTLESFPIEVGDIVANSIHASSSQTMLNTMRSLVLSAGSVRSENKAGFAVDQVAGTMLTGVDSFLSKFKGTSALTDITAAFEGVDWKTGGAFVAEALNWAAAGIKGFMQGVGDMQPAFISLFKDFMGKFTAEEIRLTTQSLGQLLLTLAKVGNIALQAGAGLTQILAAVGAIEGPSLSPSVPEDELTRPPNTNIEKPAYMPRQPVMGSNLDLDIKDALAFNVSLPSPDTDILGNSAGPKVIHYSPTYVQAAGENVDSFASRVSAAVLAVLREA